MRSVSMAVVLLTMMGGALAQDDQEEPKPIPPERVRIEVKRSGDPSPKPRDPGPRPTRTDRSLYRTRIDTSWNRFQPPGDLVARLGEMSVKKVELRREAADRFTRAGPEGIRYLVSLLGHGNLEIEDAAEFGLRRVAPDQLPVVALGLFHPHFRVRSRTALVLGKMGNKAAPVVLEMKRALLDENSFVRERVVGALARIAEPESLVDQCLVIGLADWDSFVRYRSAQGFILLGSASSPALEALGEVLALDEDGSVRISAARALETIGVPEKEVSVQLARGLAASCPETEKVVLASLEKHLQRGRGAWFGLFSLVDDRVQGKAVRAFLERTTGTRHPTEGSWRRWYGRNMGG